jgi:hypothetical protein
MTTKNTIRERHETETARTPEQRGTRYTYYTTTVYTFWDDGPFGDVYESERRDWLQHDLKQLEQACRKRASDRARWADDHIPADQVFSHTPITRVIVTVA